MLDSNYSNAGGQLSGCAVKHPFNKAKREECEKEFKSSKQSSAETDKILAQAVLNKSTQAQQQQMSPLAITGIIVGSLLAMTVMVVVIKKIKAKKG